jgi:hypothetical protein
MAAPINIGANNALNKAHILIDEAGLYGDAAGGWGHKDIPAQPIAIRLQLLDTRMRASQPNRGPELEAAGRVSGNLMYPKRGMSG